MKGPPVKVLLVLALMPLAAAAQSQVLSAPEVSGAGALDGLILLLGLIAILSKPRPR